MQQSSSEAEWIKVTSAASVVGIHPRTLKAMICDGRVTVRTLKLGQSLRIHRGDWESELAKRIRVPVSA